MHGRWYLDLGKLNEEYPGVFDLLCFVLALLVHEATVDKQQVVIIGVASGGNPIASRVAIFLETFRREKVPCVLTIKNDQKNPMVPPEELETIRGRHVVIIDDVFNLGTSAGQVLASIPAEYAAASVDLGVFWYRGPKDILLPEVRLCIAVVMHTIPMMTEAECFRNGPCSKGERVDRHYGHGADYTGKIIMT